MSSSEKIKKMDRSLDFQTIDVSIEQGSSSNDSEIIVRNGVQYRYRNGNSDEKPEMIAQQSVISNCLKGLCCLKQSEPPSSGEFDSEFRADSYLKLAFGNTAYRLIEPINTPQEIAENLPLVVCLHGLYNSSYMWGDLAHLLVTAEDGPKCRVLVFDFYGHGRSAWTQVPCSLDVYVNQTKELLEALGFAYNSVSLIGFDLGGAVAAGFAAKFPRITLSLTLLSPLGLEYNPLIPNQPYYSHSILGELMMMKDKEKLPQLILNSFYQKVKDSPPTTLMQQEQDMIRWQIGNTPGYIGALLSMFRLFPLSNMSELFQAIGRHPRSVLILWGNKDPITPFVPCHHLLKEVMSSATFVVVKEAGHSCLIEKFEETATEILAFQKLTFDAERERQIEEKLTQEK